MSAGAPEGGDRPAEADSEKVGSSVNHVLRVLTVVGAGCMILVWQIVPTPIVEDGYGHVESVIGITFALLFIGGLAFPRRMRLAVLMLSFGLVGRAYVELRLSILKVYVSDFPYIDLLSTELPLICFIYLVSFIAPSLLLIEAVRTVFRRRKENLKREAG